jgi:hypothetical protein
MPRLTTLARGVSRKFFDASSQCRSVKESADLRRGGDEGADFDFEPRVGVAEAHDRGLAIGGCHRADFEEDRFSAGEEGGAGLISLVAHKGRITTEGHGEPRRLHGGRREEGAADLRGLTRMREKPCLDPHQSARMRSNSS